MVKVNDVVIDNLRETVQVIAAFSWLWATLTVERVFLTYILLLSGLMMYYWSLSLHPDKCDIYIGGKGFRWERIR
jgi:hypothetical protein